MKQQQARAQTEAPVEMQAQEYNQHMLCALGQVLIHVLLILLS